MKSPKLKSPKINAYSICIFIFALLGACQTYRLCIGIEPFISSAMLLSATIGAWLCHAIRRETRRFRSICQEYDDLSQANDKFILFCSQVFNQQAQYSILPQSSSFLVVCRISESYFVPVKCFPFDDDPDYARLCAQELTETLNETP